VSIQWHTKPYCLKGAIQCSLIYVAPDVPSGNCNYAVVGYVVDGYACEGIVCAYAATGYVLDGYACEAPVSSYVLDGYVLIGYVEE